MLELPLRHARPAWEAPQGVEFRRVRKNCWRVKATQAAGLNAWEISARLFSAATIILRRIKAQFP
jgi:hypothetical protein